MVLKEKLSDQNWRLENLYYVIDPDGKKVLFKFNAVQKIIVKNRWFRNIILKARQLGMTTFISIFFLDSVLFGENQKALIIAHTMVDAKKIFTDKIKFAFDNLPDWLRAQFDVDANNANELRFKTNNGSISVSTSGRSGTYQFLHISEFSYICAEDPKKAREIVTGSMQTVHDNSLVFIESTARGRTGYFYDYCMRAMNNQLAEAKLSQADFKFFFFPWFEDPKYVLEGNFAIPKFLEEYFESLRIKHGIELSREQKNWYVKKYESLEEDMWQEFPSTPEEAFSTSLEGAYYKKQMNLMFHDKRITRVPFDPLLQVFTFWDLGVSDQTVILFVQFFGNQIRIIDEYLGSGEGLQHYIRILQEKSMDKGYVYGGHFAPHDIEVREMTSEAKSRKEVARSLGLRFEVVPKSSVEVGIDEVRMMLNSTWIDESGCTKTIEALQAYRKEFDEELGIWKSKPVHDWSSHPADAVRLLALSYRKIIGNAGTFVGDKDKADDPYFTQKDEDLIPGDYNTVRAF